MDHEDDSEQNKDQLVDSDASYVDLEHEKCILAKAQRP